MVGKSNINDKIYTVFEGLEHHKISGPYVK